MQILHTAWNTRRLAVISAGSQVHHMPQRYRRLLDWRNERGESWLLVRACLHGWTRGCKNYKETGSGVRRIMVYKLAQRHTFNARKQMALVVPSFKDTLGAWSLKLEVWSRKRNNRERFRSVNRFGVVRFRTEDSGELHTNYMPWLPKLESEINNRLGYVMAIV